MKSWLERLCCNLYADHYMEEHQADYAVCRAVGCRLAKLLERTFHLFEELNA